MPTAIYIVRWGEWAEERYRKGSRLLRRQSPLDWYHAPVHPGDARERLRDLAESELHAAAAIGVFDLLCQLSAAQAACRRGWLLTPWGKPLSLQQAAIAVGSRDVAATVALIELLIRAEWLAEHEPSQDWTGTELVRPRDPVRDSQDSPQKTKQSRTNARPSANAVRTAIATACAPGAPLNLDLDLELDQEITPPNPPPPASEPIPAASGGGREARPPAEAARPPARPPESPECREIREMLTAAGVLPVGVRRILAIDAVTPQTVAAWIAHCKRERMGPGLLVDSLASGQPPPAPPPVGITAEQTRKRLAEEDREWRVEVERLLDSVDGSERGEALQAAARAIIGEPASCWPPNWFEQFRVRERAAKAIRTRQLKTQRQRPEADSHREHGEHREMATALKGAAIHGDE